MPYLQRIKKRTGLRAGPRLSCLLPNVRRGWHKQIGQKYHGEGPWRGQGLEAGCTVLHVVSKVFFANISLDLREELTRSRSHRMQRRALFQDIHFFPLTLARAT